MAVQIVIGGQFDGVACGTASGGGNGYVVGSTPVCDLLHVDKDRPATLVGLKYFHHHAGHSLDDRPADKDYRITMLVSPGRWRQKIWRENSGQSIEVILQAPGDFIAWAPGHLHSWCAESDSTMLTLTFRR